MEKDQLSELLDALVLEGEIRQYTDADFVPVEPEEPKPE